MVDSYRWRSTLLQIILRFISNDMTKGDVHKKFVILFIVH